MKICLDPGHYGSNYNPGVAAGYVESNFTWDYFFLMKDRLEKYGVEVIGTRSSKDDYPKNSKGEDALQVRGRTASGCDLFISIHSNATGDTKNPRPEINSVFTHWSVRSGGREIAEQIGARLTEFFRSEWGDCQEPTMYAQESEKYPGYDYFGVLKGAASVGTPAIIVEHSFHTNPRFCEWAMVPGNIAKMADVEVDAIADYYGLTKKTNSAYYIYLDKNLKKGDKGEDVKKLQMRMRQVDREFDEEVAKHSFDQDGNPDGSFGGNMAKTIKRFQLYAGINQTGEVDDETRAILNTTVLDSHNDVSELLEENNNLKYIVKELQDSIDEAVKILTSK